MRFSYKKIVIIACIFACTLGMIPSCQASRRTDTTFLYFDTVTTVSATGLSQKEFDAFKQSLYGVLEKYHQRLDIYHEYDGVTNLCTLNQKASSAPIAVDDELFDFLLYAKEVCKKTNLYTNIAMGSVLTLWHEKREEAKEEGATPALPTRDELEAASLHMRLDDLILNPEEKTVYYADPLLKIDVGALGKGYAADMAVSHLRQLGYENFIINLGGNVIACGVKEDKTPWIGGISNPTAKDGALAYTVSLTDMALVTSAGDQRFYTVDGVRYHHIIHPQSLMPADHHASVTVLCESAALADALSTALFNMTTEEGMQLIADMEETEAVWILSDGRIQQSDGFHRYIQN